MFSSNTSQVSGGYEIQRSLRFNRPDSTYLNRTPASAGNRQTWTLSFWIKKSVVNQLEGMFRAGDFLVYFNSDTLRVEDTAGVLRDTTQVFRDYSAWYHFVITLDTPNATANDRIKVYVNGSQITSFSILTNPTQNQSLSWNNNVNHNIGTFAPGVYVFGGYMTEVNFIDGQALTPSSFGAFDAQTGVWGPTPYAGSYGTNGFYLNFSDNSNTTAATLGKDYSGNSNNWTPNNFSVSAGAGNDSLVDVPTNWGTDTGVGGSVRGNYCTWNPLKRGTGGSGLTLSNGNLEAVTPTDAITSVGGTIGVATGKWYWEVTAAAGSTYMIGIGNEAMPTNTYPGGASGWGYYTDGQKYLSDIGTAYGASYTTGDIVGVALDMDAGTLTFYKNGVSQGQAFSGITGTIFPVVGDGGTVASASFVGNFGQRPFAYTAPSGFKALNTQNLPTPTIGATTATQANDYFDVSLYTGNAGALTVTNSGMQPDFLWLKCRDTGGRGHYLYDAVRGTNKMLFTNGTDAEFTSSSYLTSFNSNGFTLGSGDTGTNANGSTYVGWQWKANGAGVTNTAGSITSTVSANTTSGFSVVTYTGNLTGAGTSTVGHGLGVAPSMIIVKSRSNTTDWCVMHRSLTSWAFQLSLNTTAAQVDSTGSGAGPRPAPTSSVFSINWVTGLGINGQTHVAYCFAEVPGYSRFGSYTGNGSTDGPFLYLGFTPKYILIKQSSAAGTNWRIVTINTSYLSANTADAQYDNPPGPIRGMSNGVKIVGTGGDINQNGSTYIYAAFAAFPFKYALAQSA